MRDWATDPKATVWPIILAGGDGARMRRLVQRWLGGYRPKQYCAFIGTRSMFQHTLDRAARLAPSERIVTVVACVHERDATEQAAGRRIGKILFQPKNRDTAAGLFLPVTYVRARDPQATIVLFPSDHFIYPERRFLEVVREAVLSIDQMPERILLLGMRPDRPERDYGWIHPADVLTQIHGRPVRAVHALVEKPGLAEAEASLCAGALWNTFVVVARVEALWKLGWRHVPAVMALFEKLGQAMGGPEEAAVQRLIYRDMPRHNFTRDVLARAAEQLAVLELDGVLWSDWGNPERIVHTLRQIRRRPIFPLDCLDQPVLDVSIRASSGVREAGASL